MFYESDTYEQGRKDAERLNYEEKKKVFELYGNNNTAFYYAMRRNVCTSHMRICDAIQKNASLCKIENHDDVPTRKRGSM